MNVKALVAIVAITLLLGACSKGGGGGASAAPPPPPPGSSDWDRMVWDQDNWG